LAGLPDAVTTVEDWIAEGNKVAARGVVTGTHLGDFAGIAATRRRVSYNAMRIFALDGGKVTEGWFVFDLDGLMRQAHRPCSARRVILSLEGPCCSSCRSGSGSKDPLTPCAVPSSDLKVDIGDLIVEGDVVDPPLVGTALTPKEASATRIGSCP